MYNFWRSFEVQPTMCIIDRTVVDFAGLNGYWFDVMRQQA